MFFDPKISYISTNQGNIRDTGPDKEKDGPCINQSESEFIYIYSGEASGHAGHAEHDQKYSRVKNFFTCLKMEVCFEIFLKKSNPALVNYVVSYVHW